MMINLFTSWYSIYGVTVFIAINWFIIETVRESYLDLGKLMILWLCALIWPIVAALRVASNIYYTYIVTSHDKL